MAGIIKRLKRAISAEVHEMIDEHESPDRIASQLVRETTDKVDKAQKLTIEAVTSEKQLALQLKDHNDNLLKAQSTAEQSLKKGDEVTTRRALENKLHHQKLIDTLQPQLTRAESNSASLKTQLANLQKQLNSLQSEKIALEARYNGAKATGKIEAMSAEIQMVDDTKSRLQKANSMVTAMEARNEAVADVAQVTDPCGNHTAADQDVDFELQKLRDQIK